MGAATSLPPLMLATAVTASEDGHAARLAGAILTTMQTQQLQVVAARFRAFQRIEMMQQARATILTSVEDAFGKHSDGADTVPHLSMLQQSARRFKHPEVGLPQLCTLHLASMLKS